MPKENAAEAALSGARCLRLRRSLHRCRRSISPAGRTLVGRNARQCNMPACAGVSMPDLAGRQGTGEGESERSRSRPRVATTCCSSGRPVPARACSREGCPACLPDMSTRTKHWRPPPSSRSRGMRTHRRLAAATVSCATSFSATAAALVGGGKVSWGPARSRGHITVCCFSMSCRNSTATCSRHAARTARIRLGQSCARRPARGVPGAGAARGRDESRVPCGYLGDAQAELPLQRRSHCEHTATRYRDHCWIESTCRSRSPRPSTTVHSFCVIRARQTKRSRDGRGASSCVPRESIQLKSRNGATATRGSKVQRSSRMRRARQMMSAGGCSRTPRTAFQSLRTGTPARILRVVTHDRGPGRQPKK